MFKSVGSTVWAFDVEWVPDVAAGRRVYDLPSMLPAGEIMAEMWRRGGATAEQPRPYLKTVLCRIVSIVAVARQRHEGGEVSLELKSLPRHPYGAMEEADLLARFFEAAGRARPQLVGFNSANADLPILIQRGIATGIAAREFCRRPDKPWEGTDYFNRHSDAHVDLKEVVGGWGKGTPSLHELAEVSGIPGKMGIEGSDVAGLWLAGEVRRIVEYNQLDAVTTYLIWLRTAHFAGFFVDRELVQEEERLRALLAERIEGGDVHFVRFIERWDDLQRQTGRLGPPGSGAAGSPGAASPATAGESAAGRAKEPMQP